MSGIDGKKPLVSVIVPTFNRARRLQSALASIWAQEGLGEQFDVEPIVIDDASTEPTEEVARGFPGTRYLRFETNRGLAAARNAGLGEATGKYVAFLDDDDLWLPHRLSDQVSLLEQAQGVEVAYSQYVVYERDGNSYVDPHGEGPSGWIFEALLKSRIPRLDTILVPRKAWDQVDGFDESLAIGEDRLPPGIETDIVLRLALYFPFRYIRGVVTIVLPSMADHSDPQAHRRSLLIRRDRILALVRGQSNEAEIGRLTRSLTSWHVAHRFYLAGEFDQARREFLKWLDEFPPLEADDWARSRMNELMLLLVLASDLPVEAARSLCGEIKRTGGRGGLRQRLEMRRLLADLWTAVAIRLASGRQRDDALAGSAAARAILQNPLKPLSRPGLLRLVARAIAPSS